MIREGCDVESASKNKTIPENYKAVLDPAMAEHTSVRRPRDYPVLGERFKDKAVE